MKVKGLKDTMHQLYDDDDKWQVFEEKVRTGEERWVNLAISFSEFADGASSEDLGMALSAALIKSPITVLKRLKLSYSDPGRLFSVPDVCGRINLLDQSLKSDAASKAYLLKQRGAVVKVSDPLLKVKRDQCIAAIDSELRVYGGAKK